MAHERATKHSHRRRKGGGLWLTLTIGAAFDSGLESVSAGSPSGSRGAGTELRPREPCPAALYRLGFPLRGSHRRQSTMVSYRSALRGRTSKGNQGLVPLGPEGEDK